MVYSTDGFCTQTRAGCVWLARPPATLLNSNGWQRGTVPDFDTHDCTINFSSEVQPSHIMLCIHADATGHQMCSRSKEPNMSELVLLNSRGEALICSDMGDSICWSQQASRPTACLSHGARSNDCDRYFASALDYFAFRVPVGKRFWLHLHINWATRSFLTRVDAPEPVEFPNATGADYGDACRDCKWPFAT